MGKYEQTTERLYNDLRKLSYDHYRKAIERSEIICLNLREAKLTLRQQARIERSVVGIYLELLSEKK